MSFSALNIEQLLAIAATGVAGVITGCLTFVSAVDARSFLAHLEKKETRLIRQHFPIWWPNGAYLMAPLLLTAALTHGAAYYMSSNLNWANSGSILTLILPYTGLVLGEDVQSLMKADTKEVANTTKRFCDLHHVCLAMAMVGFGLSLISLAEL